MRKRGNNKLKTNQLNGWKDVPYPTLGTNVYLGRYPRKDIASRAKMAGLVPVTGKQFTEIMQSMQTIARLMIEGRWYDTIKYNTGTRQHG